MIQVRKQFNNLYIRILDTDTTFDLTLERIRNIPNRTFITTTGEWMVGQEQLGDLLLNFNNQIIWNQPLKDIVGDLLVNNELVQKHLDWETSDDFKGFILPPYPYQKVGAHFLADRGSAAIFDGVGLGKSIQIIGAAQILMNRKKVKRVLIVTLNSLKRQWAKEVEKFTTHKALAVTGTAARRKKIIREFNKRDDIQFLMVNYETLRNPDNLKLIKQCDFDMVALDEAQKIKSGVDDKLLGITPSQNAAACYQLTDIPYRFIATATPVQSKAEEVWSLFNFVNADVLGSWETFRERFCKYHPRYGITGSENLGELYYKIAPHFIRRTKEMPEIQQQLPAVTHSHVFLERTDAQCKIEESILNKMAELKDQSRSIGGSKVINGNLMSPESQKEYYDGMMQGMYTFLIENCDTPALLTHREASKMSKALVSELGIAPKDIEKSPKIEHFKDFIKQLFHDEPSSKVVIFTEYERMARMLHEDYKDVGVLYTGQISDNQKEFVVEKFRNDPGCRLFFSTRAGATGLNLQVANNLIHFDLPFIATEIEQRNGRIDRTGNTFKNITMFYYVMTESYEEQLLELLNKKSNMASEILTGNAGGSSKGPDVTKLALERLMKSKQKT